LDGPLPLSFTQWGFSALEQGYSVLLYDGPGQGIVRRTPPFLPITPRWDRVLAAVLDYVSSSELNEYVDTGAIVAHGYSLGGWLVAQACTQLSDRLAACVVDPPLLSMFDSMVAPLAAYALSPFENTDDSLIPASYLPYIRNASLLFTQMLAPTCIAGIETMREVMAQVPQPADPAIYYFAYELGLNASSPDFQMIAANLTLLTPYYADAMSASLSLSMSSYNVENITCPVIVGASLDDTFESTSLTDQWFFSLNDVTRDASTLLQFPADTGAALHCQIGSVDVWATAVYDLLDPLLE